MSKAKRKPFTLAEARLIGEQLGVNWAQLNRTQSVTEMKAERADGTADPFTRYTSADPIPVGKVIRAYLN